MKFYCYICLLFLQQAALQLFRWEMALRVLGTRPRFQAPLSTPLSPLRMTKEKLSADSSRSCPEASKIVSKVNESSSQYEDVDVTGKKPKREATLVISRNHDFILAKKTEGRDHIGTHTQGTVADVNNPRMIYVIVFYSQ